MLTETKKMYIDGQWALGQAGKTRQIINPADNSCCAVVTEGDEGDVALAVKAAKRAFQPATEWRAMSNTGRAALLNRLADLIEENAEKIAEAETMNTGKLYRETEGDVYGAASMFRTFAGIIGTPSGQTFNSRTDLMTITVKEPMGVCGILVPWNYPITTAAVSMAPALAAGCTIVVKPSSITPLSIVLLFELIDKAGFPPGVANLVLGDGSTVGNAIADSPDVDKIVFTGGTDTGREIIRKSAVNIKSLELELGGKSPVILFEDYDIDLAVDNILFGIFLSQGQLCTAGSRLLVQESIYDDVIQKLGERAEKIKIGIGKEPEAEMGPMISEAHMNKVLGYIEVGKKEGARLVCGGQRVIEGRFAKGFFLQPTVFADVTNDMVIAQEEIFGPVLVVERFSDINEAIAIANDTVYGLAGGVYTNDLTKAMTVVKSLRAGNIWVNTYLDGISDAPAGGVKQSGLGLILGTVGLESFMDQKQVNICIHQQKTGWFAE